MDWYLLALSKYAQFSGRSRRKEYWMYSLISGMIWLVLYGGGVVMLPHRGLAMLLLVLSGIYALGMLVPNLSCGVRRLHDTGRSGWCSTGPTRFWPRTRPTSTGPTWRRRWSTGSGSNG